MPLCARLQELYWKPDHIAQLAMAFWEDILRYHYRPCLESRRRLCILLGF